ncbi:unnamed protein product, partial [Polarella glacialis]
ASEALESYLALESDAASQGDARWRVGCAKHWLAVLRGENSATAPAEYVAKLFDSYADKFDEHLVEKLGYHTPELLAEEIRITTETLAREGKTASLRRCADLGCGTGLMGPPLRKLGVEWLEGVDLSANMLQKAREKGRGYDRLVCGDLVDIFEPGQDGKSPTFDLVVAADVFVYVGDLKPALAATARSLVKPHGLVAFSTEAPPCKGGSNEDEGAVPEDGFKLTETGRYIHCATYVQRTAEACGLSLWATKDVVLRKNGGKPVHGHIHILRHAT